MRISNLAAGLAEIAAEDDELLAMQDRRYEGDGTFVDPMAILARLNANIRRKAQLESELAAERQALLQASRRLDVIESWTADRRREQEKKAETGVIDELVAGKLRFGSSLP